jgi:hypothetical protein
MSYNQYKGPYENPSDPSIKIVNKEEACKTIPTVSIRAEDMYKIAEEGILKDESLYNEEAQIEIDAISNKIHDLAKQKALFYTASVKNEISSRVQSAFEGAGFLVKIISSNRSGYTALEISWDKKKKAIKTYCPPW